jgi:lysophospholipase L1-like esterase
MVSYGHSWVDGDGASTRSSSLAVLAAEQLGLELDNRGVGGSSSTGTAALTLASPPPPAALYLVMTGLNDLRLGGDAPSSLEQYVEALQAIFGAIRQSSPDALVVALAQPHLVDFRLHAPHNRGSNALVDTYNQELRRVAAAHPGVVVVEPDGWDAASMLDPDTVHPNDAGHLCLARAAVGAVTSAWQ